MGAMLRYDAVGGLALSSRPRQHRVQSGRPWWGDTNDEWVVGWSLVGEASRINGRINIGQAFIAFTPYIYISITGYETYVEVLLSQFSCLTWRGGCCCFCEISHLDWMQINDLKWTGNWKWENRLRIITYWQTFLLVLCDMGIWVPTTRETKRNVKHVQQYVSNSVQHPLHAILGYSNHWWIRENGSVMSPGEAAHGQIIRYTYINIWKVKHFSENILQRGNFSVLLLRVTSTSSSTTGRRVYQQQQHCHQCCHRPRSFPFQKVSIVVAWNSMSVFCGALVSGKNRAISSMSKRRAERYAGISPRRIQQIIQCPCCNYIISPLCSVVSWLMKWKPINWHGPVRILLPYSSSKQPR